MELFPFELKALVNQNVACKIQITDFCKDNTICEYKILKITKSQSILEELDKHVADLQVFILHLWLNLQLVLFL